MSKLTRFYSGNAQDSEGRSFEDIMRYSHDKMEFCHDYIQWIFPTKTASAFNPDAPLLSIDDIVLFREHRNPYTGENDLQENLLRAFQKFLDFMGIQTLFYVSEKAKHDCVNTTIELDVRFETIIGYERAANFADRKSVWLEFNHNSLRITRIFECLTLLGHRVEAAALLKFMQQTAAEESVQFSENTLNFWKNAILKN